MDFSFNEVKEIAETLPIGYYAKRKVAVAFDEKADTSYYNPAEDKITFAYNNIRVALTNAENMDKEVAIRSILYHELSHAILTPAFPNVPVWLNIFEDERIETLLKKYYMNTDFNGLLNAISPYNGNPPQSAEEAFFNLCRHRIGKKEFLDRVEEIIKDYAFVSAKDLCFNCCGRANSYYYAVRDLFRALEKDFEKDKKNYQKGSYSKKPTVHPRKGMSTYDEDIEDGVSLEEKEKIDASKNSSEEKIQKKVTGKRSKSKNQEENSENSSSGNSTPAENSGNESESKEENKVDEANRNGLGDKIFKSAMGRFQDTSLTEKLGNIISIFNKKNNSGCGTVGHSGILNPRYCGNGDYRFFERKLESRGNNRFGSLNLNLFIDVSGSFYNNTIVVNKLLSALLQIERKNKNFTLNVVHCGVGEELKDKSNCFIDPNGGNKVTSEFAKIFRKLQKTGTYNYNIILFDGWCEPYDRKKAFACADTCNTTIISDRENDFFGEMKNAKVVFTKQYAKELYTHVMTALQRAFR